MGDFLFSVGQVSKKIGVQVHTIRFWLDEFPHIECEVRNGRRYFSRRSIEEFEKIKDLVHGRKIRIDGIKRMVKYNKIQSLDGSNEKNSEQPCDGRYLQLINEIRDIVYE